MSCVEESESEIIADEPNMSMTDDVQLDEKCFVYDDEDDNDDHHNNEEDDTDEGESPEDVDQLQA